MAKFIQRTVREMGLEGKESFGGVEEVLRWMMGFKYSASEM